MNLLKKRKEQLENLQNINQEQDIELLKQYSFLKKISNDPDFEYFRNFLQNEYSKYFENILNQGHISNKTNQEDLKVFYTSVGVLNFLDYLNEQILSVDEIIKNLASKIELKDNEKNIDFDFLKNIKQENDT